ncbi:hypothetical protein [Porphyrobacter sp. MBR-155]|uniref:hypothetical protein n=1 Tax=Porphyrobacter sp. MBR-155 TaxID=3156464 RepID=UPI00339238AD
MDASSVIRRLTQRLYGCPIIRNDLRGELVEEIVAAALEPEWRLCSTDWGSCDLVHSTRKIGIQVKQSAARQTWHKDNLVLPRPRFSIKEKTGRWEDGSRWVAKPSRNAEVFVFAWHSDTSDAADHRDPQQWQFFVVAERDLPPQGSIALSRLQSLVEPVQFAQLAMRVRSLIDAV